VVPQAPLDVQKLLAPNVILEMLLKQSKIRFHQIAGAPRPSWRLARTISPGPLQGNRRQSPITLA
jgi:hypothetical protein